jgi:hypothetical protein
LTLRLNGSTSGYTEIDAPAAAGNNTLLLPTGNGSNGDILGTDGAGNLSWVQGRMVRETAKASTSGTSVEFTGIPSWAKRVTLMLQGVSTNGTSPVMAQLGTSSGYATSGYTGTIELVVNGGVAASTFTSSFLFEFAGYTGATATLHGLLTIVNINSNAWVAQGTIGRGDAGTANTVSGSISLASAFDRIRISTVAGTNTFDAGTVNILYEG